MLVTFWNLFDVEFSQQNQQNLEEFTNLFSGFLDEILFHVISTKFRILIFVTVIATLSRIVQL